ncbi:hypothetical protein XENTR_v10015560 [Xenopus tropicalis]|nr:hypothetical protein XENTR_v10015560 [Xenopus tropicalis]
MFFKVALLRKIFSTYFTFETYMNSVVQAKLFQIRKHFVTLSTYIGIVFVSYFMLLEAVPIGKTFPTFSTGEWFLPRVNSVMYTKGGL